MSLSLQPPYLAHYSKPEIYSRFQLLKAIDTNDTLSVDNLITALAKKVFSDGTRKPVEEAVKRFLCLTEHQIKRNKHLQEGEYNNRIRFLKLLASDKEDYEYSKANIVDSLGQEYTAFTHMYKCSKHRGTVKDFIRFIKENATPEDRFYDSFRKRGVFVSILDSTNKACIIDNLRDFIEAKTPGVFKLVNRLNTDDNQKGVCFELASANALKKSGFQIIELSHNFKQADHNDKPVDREIDIVAQKDNEKFFIEAKCSEKRIYPSQINDLIQRAKESGAKPVLIIGKKLDEIVRNEINYLLSGIRSYHHLRIWDKCLNDITDRFSPVELSYSIYDRSNLPFLLGLS